MLDMNGNVCEYDGYKLPPAPEVITPEMIRQKNELMEEMKRFIAEVTGKNMNT